MRRSLQPVPAADARVTVGDFTSSTQSRSQPSLTSKIGASSQLGRWVTRGLLIIALVSLLPGKSSQAGPDDSSDGPPKVLFVGKNPDHPFGSHMYLHTCGVLAKCLNNHGVETIVSNGWPEDEEKLQGIRTIVVYTSPGAEFLLDGPQRDSVAKLLNQGVGLVTIHWASSIYQENLERLGPDWLRYLGGTWVSNVGLHTGVSQLRQLEPKHPVCRGWQPFELHDEYYLNPTIDHATPVLEVTANDKPVVVGWAFERPQGGKSFGTTLGHFYRNFQVQPFRKMIVNAVLWTADVDVPETGANVALAADDLALPEDPSAGQ